MAAPAPPLERALVAPEAWRSALALAPAAAAAGGGGAAITAGGPARRLTGLALELGHAAAHLLDRGGDLGGGGLHRADRTLLQLGDDGGHAAERLHVGGSAAVEDVHRLGLGLQEDVADLLDLGQDALEGVAHAVKLVGGPGPPGAALAHVLHLAPELVHRVLDHRGLTLGDGPHAVRDDLPGAGERLEVATLRLDPGARIERDRRLARHAASPEGLGAGG